MGERGINARDQAVKGAGYGGAAGSIFGPKGTLIGAGVGAAVGGIYGYNKSKKNYDNISNIDSTQSGNLNKSLDQLGKNYANPSTDFSQGSSMRFLQNQINPRMAQTFGNVRSAVNNSMGKNFWGSSINNANRLAATNYQRNMQQKAADQFYQDEQMRQKMNESAMNRRLEGLGVRGKLATNQTFDTVKRSDLFDRLAGAAGTGSMIGAAYKSGK